MSSDSHETFERREVLYRGHVQGVGFRYTARGFAQRHGLVGYVQNLPDGRVRMIAEGSPAALDRLLAAIAGEMERFIRDTQIDISPASGEFDQFVVRQ